MKTFSIAAWCFGISPAGRYTSPLVLTPATPSARSAQICRCWGATQDSNRTARLAPNVFPVIAVDTQQHLR